MTEKISDILALFGISGDISAETIDAGHINSTCLVRCGGEKYILQTLSREVFRYPENIAYNIGSVLRAFSVPGQDFAAVPGFLFHEGNCLVQYGGNYHRVYRYIRPEGELSPYTAARAFGTFIRVLSDADVKLRQTTDQLHCFEKHLDRLLSLGKSFEGIDILKDTGAALNGVFDALPKRCIHGDAKPDNLIPGKKIMIIDLDTAMESFPAVDLGDLVRSFCTADSFEEEKFRELCRGFADGLGGLLTREEVGSLYYGILWITGELAARYMYDGISRSGYFKGKTPGQCIMRAESLLRQLRIFRENEKLMKDIIMSVFRYL